MFRTEETESVPVASYLTWDLPPRMPTTRPARGIAQLKGWTVAMGVNTSPTGCRGRPAGYTDNKRTVSTYSP